jgi:hypothetical protein
MRQKGIRDGGDGCDHESGGIESERVNRGGHGEQHTAEDRADEPPICSPTAVTALAPAGCAGSTNDGTMLTLAGQKNASATSSTIATTNNEQVDNAPRPTQSVSTALDGLAINRWPQFTRQAGQ